MKTSLGLALATIALGLAGLINACGGAENMDVPGEVGPATTTSSGASGTTTSSGASGSTTSSGASGTASSSGSTSGNTSSSSSSSSSGTSGCIPCPTPAPKGCSYPDPCQCTYTCPDSGGALTCTWTQDGRGGCPDGYYCDASDCITGQCVKRGVAESADRSPQCGCNGVTFWNAAIAKKTGMAIRASGACKPDAAKSCAGGCPVGASCNMQVSKKSECNASGGAGTCWGMPSACPLVTIGGRSRPCGAAVVSCVDECSAIRKQSQWFDDGSCPQ